MDDQLIGTKIKVVGVGGAGNNAINDMIENNLNGIEYLAINTDEQVLKVSKAQEKLALGHLGAGADPQVAKQAAEEKMGEIKNTLVGLDMVFITAGMGGGTGTGAAPVVAKIAKEVGILTVAVVTKPFTFEGKVRMKNFEYGIKELKDKVDALIIVPNQKLSEISSGGNFLEVFKLSNHVLRDAVRGITELIISVGTINLDFADVKAVLKNSGIALFGLVESEEDDDNETIVDKLINNPLLERDIKGSKQILVNFTVGPNTSITTVEQISELISKRASGSVGGVENLMFGLVIDNERTNIKISMIATGYDDVEEENQFEEEIRIDAPMGGSTLPPFNF